MFDSCHSENAPPPDLVIMKKFVEPGVNKPLKNLQPGILHVKLYAWYPGLLVAAILQTFKEIGVELILYVLNDRNSRCVLGGLNKKKFKETVSMIKKWWVCERSEQVGLAPYLLLNLNQRFFLHNL